MNNTFSLEQTSKTGSLDARLILQQHKLDLISWFMKLKSISSKLGQDEITEVIGCSSSTLQRHRQEIKLLSTYRIPSKNHKRRQKFPKTSLDDKSHREHAPGANCRRGLHDLKRPQMTSKDLKRLNSLNMSQTQKRKGTPARD